MWSEFWTDVEAEAMKSTYWPYEKSVDRYLAVGRPECFYKDILEYFSKPWTNKVKNEMQT